MLFMIGELSCTRRREKKVPESERNAKTILGEEWKSRRPVGLTLKISQGGLGLCNFLCRKFHNILLRLKLASLPGQRGLELSRKALREGFHKAAIFYSPQTPVAIGFKTRDPFNIGFLWKYSCVRGRLLVSASGSYSPSQGPS